jgi:hypothetical protein
MQDASEKRLLAEIRRWEDPGPVRWRDPWWNYLLVVGGIAVIVSEAVDTGRINGGAGGLMLGVGLAALLISVPLSRRLRGAYRLVRCADEAKAYDGD